MAARKLWQGYLRKSPVVPMNALPASQPVLEEQPTKSEKPLKPEPNLIGNLSKFFLERQGSCIFFAAETGSGKTTLLYKLLSELLQKSNGKADISVIDAKGSYWPLENYGKDRVICIDRSNPESIINSLNKALEKMRSANLLMGKRAKERIECERQGKAWNPHPYILILDEWIGLREYFERWDKKIAAEVDALFANIIIMGREDGIFVIASGQTHRSEIVKIPTGYRDNVALVGLSKSDFAESSACIDSMVADQWVVKSAKIRTNLQELIETFRTNNNKFAYCSLSGHYCCSMPIMNKQANREELEKLLSIFYKSDNNLIQFPINDDFWKPSVI